MKWYVFFLWQNIHRILSSPFFFSYAHDSLFSTLLAETCCTNTWINQLLVWSWSTSAKLSHCHTMKCSTMKLFSQRWPLRICQLCSRNYHSAETKVRLTTSFSYFKVWKYFLKKVLLIHSNFTVIYNSLWLWGGINYNRNFYLIR